jgi:hypothetical protein
LRELWKLFWFLECTTELRPTMFDVSKWESVYTFLLRRVLIKLGLWSWPWSKGKLNLWAEGHLRLTAFWPCFTSRVGQSLTWLLDYWTFAEALGWIKVPF